MSRKASVMTTKVYNVYCSPAGSTRHVSQVMAREMEAAGFDVISLDLARQGREASSVPDGIGTAGSCLMLGSPVYRDMAVPPVMAFIESLPAVNGCPAVIHASWGGACSGIALWQMAKALAAKGFFLAGAVKVLAVHSLMWDSDSPVGNGHPDAGDDAVVRQFVRDIAHGLHGRSLRPLDLARLDYQSDEHAAEMKQKLEKPWMIIPKTVDETLCTECGTCVDVCPSDAIELAPVPVFQPRCFDCFNCIRHCPENAISAAVSLKDIGKHIRSRVETFNEQPGTLGFIG